MIGVAHRAIQAGNFRQQIFAFFERDAPQIVAVEIEQIEDVVQHGNIVTRSGATPARPNSCTLLHQAERRASVFVESGDFTVKNGSLRLDERRNAVQFGILRREVVLIA